MDNAINNIKFIEYWKGCQGFIINDISFVVYCETIGEKIINDYTFKPIKEYSIYIAYDFNVSNKIKLSAKNMKQLESKLNKIEYKIVKPY